MIFFNIKVVKLLLKNGANPNIENESGKRPIDVCRDNKVKCLLEIALKGENFEEMQDDEECNKQRVVKDSDEVFFIKSGSVTPTSEKKVKQSLSTSSPQSKQLLSPSMDKASHEFDKSSSKESFHSDASSENEEESLSGHIQTAVQHSSLAIVPSAVADLDSKHLMENKNDNVTNYLTPSRSNVKNKELSSLPQNMTAKVENSHSKLECDRECLVPDPITFVATTSSSVQLQVPVNVDKSILHTVETSSPSTKTISPVAKESHSILLNPQCIPPIHPHHLTPTVDPLSLTISLPLNLVHIEHTAIDKLLIEQNTRKNQQCAIVNVASTKMQECQSAASQYTLKEDTRDADFGISPSPCGKESSDDDSHSTVVSLPLMFTSCIQHSHSPKSQTPPITNIVEEAKIVSNPQQISRDHSANLTLHSSTSDPDFSIITASSNTPISTSSFISMNSKQNPFPAFSDIKG